MSPRTVVTWAQNTTLFHDSGLAFKLSFLNLRQGKPVKVLLRSIDVLHDFYVPEFRAKMDMVPGMVTYFWLTPTRTGTYETLCFELCGLGHPDMRGIVVVDEPSDYRAWLDGQTTFAQMAAGRAGRVDARLDQRAKSIAE